MSTVHTYPVADLIEHETEGDGCPCGPQVVQVIGPDGTAGKQVIHHSLDGRELREQQR